MCFIKLFLFSLSYGSDDVSREGELLILSLKGDNAAQKRLNEIKKETQEHCIITLLS